MGSDSEEDSHSPAEVLSCLLGPPENDASADNPFLMSLVRKLLTNEATPGANEVVIFFLEYVVKKNVEKLREDEEIQNHFIKMNDNLQQRFNDRREMSERNIKLGESRSTAACDSQDDRSPDEDFVANAEAAGSEQMPRKPRKRSSATSTSSLSGKKPRVEGTQDKGENNTMSKSNIIQGKKEAARRMWHLLMEEAANNDELVKKLQHATAGAIPERNMLRQILETYIFFPDMQRLFEEICDNEQHSEEKESCFLSLVAQRTSGACTTTSLSTIPPEYLEALIQVSVKKSNNKAVLIKEVFSHVDELKKLIVSRGLEKADPPTKDRDHTRRFDVSFGNSKDPTPWKYRESKYPEDEEDHARIREEAETTAGCWKCFLECIVNPALKTPPWHFGCKCNIKTCMNQLYLFLEIPVPKEEPVKQEEERRLFRKEAVLLMTLRALRKAKGYMEADFLREAIKDRIPPVHSK